MIWSRYNEFVTNQDNYSLFNCRTKKWLNIVPELYTILTKNKDDVEIIKRVHPTLFETLVENKFVVNNEKDEISECMAEIEKKLNESETLKLTINPTLDCNLRCWYCYEEHLKGSIMRKETIAAVCTYVKNVFEKHSYRMLQLSFFGGEPLLKFNSVVYPLIVEIKQICDYYHVSLKVSFTSNGVCLTNKIIEAIREVITDVSFQIPFDGDTHYHNKTKKFPNGKGSYDIVKQNVRNAVFAGFRVTVRCNFTKENVRSFKSVISEFEDLHSCSNFRFSFHKVWQEKDDNELKSGVIDLKSSVSGMNFTSNMHSYFGDSVNPCYGDYANNLVVNYNGDVFKCTAREFNTENKIGKLMNDGKVIYNDNALKRERNRWTYDCYTCRRLPICPICSQVKSESSDGKCPVNISSEAISENIREYCIDLQTKIKHS